MRAVSAKGILALAAVLATSSAAVIWAQVGQQPTGPRGRALVPPRAVPTKEQPPANAPAFPAVQPRTGLTGQAANVRIGGSGPVERSERLPVFAQAEAADEPNPFSGTAPDPGFAADPAVIPAYAALLGPNSASLTVDWVTPETIILGQEADFELVLRNRGRAAVEQIIVEQVLPEGFRLVRANPAAQEGPGEPSWMLPRIEPQQEGRIVLRLVAEKVGQAQSRARVHFSTGSSATFRVVEPKLEIEAETPAEAIVGNQAILNVTVRNPGTGRATNAILNVELPKELVAAGQNLRYELGTLNPGEARSVRILAQVTDLGRHECKFIATADNGLRDEDTKAFDSVGARLEIVIEGPKLRYVTRPADYEVRVRNTGTSTAHNVHLQVRVPKAFAYLDGGRHGRFDSQTKTVNWFVGQLEVGKDYVGEFRLQAQERGEFPIVAHAEAERGHRAETQHLTRIEGIAAILLEVVDVADPIEVGAETLYEVLVTNQGTDFAENVQIVTKVPEGMEITGAKGPVQGAIEGRTVTFAALPKLAPQADAIYRIQVRGLATGDLRVEVQATADSLESPVIELESTKVYAD